MCVFGEPQYERSFENKIESFFQDSKTFHNSVLNQLEKATYFRPAYFVVTYDAKGGGARSRRFYDVNDFTEKFPEQSDVVATVPYYSFLSLVNGSTLRFAFAFPRSEIPNMVYVNDALVSLYLRGAVDEFAQSRGLLKKSSFLRPKHKVDVKVLVEILVIIVLLVLNVLLVALYTFLSQKKQSKKVQKVYEASLRSMEIATEKAEYVKEIITDHITGLFTIGYLSSLIQDEISKFHYFGKVFCVAIFKVPYTGSHAVAKSIADVITENLNRNVISAYRGRGIYVCFFPEKSEEDIGIFVDLTAEKIDDFNIPVVTRIYEFKGQKNFMESLDLAGDFERYEKI